MPHTSSSDSLYFYKWFPVCLFVLFLSFMIQTYHNYSTIFFYPRPPLLALMSAAIFGNVSSIMLRLYQGTEEFHEKKTSIQEFINFHHIPKQLANRLVESCQHNWSYTNGIDMNSVSATWRVISVFCRVTCRVFCMCCRPNGVLQVMYTTIILENHYLHEWQNIGEKINKPKFLFVRQNRFRYRELYVGL